MNNIEILADNEHNRWANWQKYVHSKCMKNEDGSLTIPKEYVEHWDYEINTKYKDLPENIKESDRNEVRQILKLLNVEELKEKTNKAISMLEKHIQYCEQETKGSLNNKVCNIALRFDKHLLQVLKGE